MENWFSLLEGIAAALGILSVWFSRRISVLTYPFGIVSVAIYIFLCWEVRLYADAGINGWYFLMSMYGWIRWQAAETNQAVSVSRLDRKSASIGLGLALVAFLALGWVLGSFTDSDVPWIDAFTSAMAIAGMYWMAEKKLEHWLAWSVVNVVSIPLYLYKDMPLTALQYLVFLLFTFQGWKIWKRVVA